MSTTPARPEQTVLDLKSSALIRARLKRAALRGASKEEAYLLGAREGLRIAAEISPASIVQELPPPPFGAAAKALGAALLSRLARIIR